MRSALLRARLSGLAIFPWGLIFGLSACGEAPSNVQRASQQRSAAVEERFGPRFAEISTADANAKPQEVSSGDLPPVSLTEEPIDF